MKRHGKPTLLVIVWGDWRTIISAREYRDELLEQKPDSEEDADFGDYRIRCADTEAMVKAYQVFHDVHKCKVTFGIDFRSEDKAINVFSSTGDGLSDSGPYCDVTVNAPLGAIEEAAKKAIELLKAAIK